MRTPDVIAAAAKSIAARIKDLARNRREDPLQVQVRFVLERFLARLANSPHADDVCLKGGMLMLTLNGQQNRPTQDIDLHLDSGMAEAQVRNLVHDVATLPPGQEDGVVFDLTDLRVEFIRDGVMPGYRVSFYGDLATQPRPSRVRMKLDLAWGETVDARMIEMPPAIRGFDPVRIRAYPWELVVAEKLHAAHRHGRANTRLKDYYDLVVIARSITIDGVEATRAVRSTFEAWGSGAPDVDTPALTLQWAGDNERAWAAFKKGKVLAFDAGSLSQAIAEIRELSVPLMEAANTSSDLEATWTPGAGWQVSPTPTPF